MLTLVFCLSFSEAFLAIKKIKQTKKHVSFGWTHIEMPAEVLQIAVCVQTLQVVTPQAPGFLNVRANRFKGGFQKRQRCT